MLKLSLFKAFILCLALLVGPALAEDAVTTKITKVAYVPITVRGDYQPLDAAAVNELFLQTLKASAPELEFFPLQVDMESLDPDAVVKQAFATAQANGAEMIAWGSVSFQRSSQTSRTDAFNRGRLKYLITAIADIQVASVANQERILSQPTMVTSSDQSNSFTETGDPQTELRLAKESVAQAAKSIVEVVRKRRAGGA